MASRAGVKISVEQGIHQGGLSKAGLADAHNVEGEAGGDTLVDQLVRQGVETDVAAQVEITHLGATTSTSVLSSSCLLGNK